MTKRRDRRGNQNSAGGRRGRFSDNVRVKQLRLRNITNKERDRRDKISIGMKLFHIKKRISKRDKWIQEHKAELRAVRIGTHPGTKATWFWSDGVGRASPKLMNLFSRVIAEGVDSVVA
jgi:hypothetical protein